MNETDLIWMSLVVFLPSLFALVLMFFPKGYEEAMRWWSLFGTALTLGVSVCVFIMYRAEVVDYNSGGDAKVSSRTKISLQYRTNVSDSAPVGSPAHMNSQDWIGKHEWIPRFNIEYFLGADGISLPLVLLTTVLCFLAMIASWKIDKFVRGYCILFLVLETGMLGTFLALDFFLFYIFWEVMLLPMYFLIGVWGGPRREYAAIKFFLYTLLGSVFILIALLGFYFTDVRDFVSSDKVTAAAKANIPKDVKEKLDKALASADTAYNQANENVDAKREALAKADPKVAKEKQKAAKEDLDKRKQEQDKATKALADANAALKKAKDELDKKKDDEDLKKAVATKTEAVKDAEKALATISEAVVTATGALKGADTAVKAADVKEQNATKEFKDADKKEADAAAARDRARLAYEGELAKQAATVNTFDLILLSRVGKAAMQYRDSNGKVEAVSAPAVEKAVTMKKDLVSRYGNTPTPAQQKNLDEAEKLIVTAKAGLEKRLEQPFFQGWFQKMMFLFLFIGFAIKVPVFPFHTWLPDAHVEAPTPISMILAGVLLKLGGYGIIRLCYPICPWAAHEWAWGIALFGIINIVYGAFAAMAQTDFKKLVAYSSVSHMGYVILGIAIWAKSPENSAYWSWGLNGAMFQMLAHGITSAGMFFCVGVIYDRAHHRNLDNFRGLYEPMPLYGGISAIIFFAAMGLPGLAGFVGEFMVVVGTWDFSPAFAIIAAATVVITAAYILWTIQRVFMGTNASYKNFPDINPRELTAVIPLVIMSVVFGVFPALILTWMEPSVTNLIDSLLAVK